MKDFKERVKNTWAFRKLSASEKEIQLERLNIAYLHDCFSNCWLSSYSVWEKKTLTTVEFKNIVKELWLSDINVEFEIIKP